MEKTFSSVMDRKFWKVITHILHAQNMKKLHSFTWGAGRNSWMNGEDTVSILVMELPVSMFKTSQ